MRLLRNSSSVQLIVGPVLNKTLEIGVSKRYAPNDGFDFSWRLRTRCDHAGITCFMRLGSWRFFEWNLHDVRHWDDRAGRYYASEDEYERVLNTPLDDP
jgi:hypothetical protein